MGSRRRAGLAILLALSGCGACDRAHRESAALELEPCQIGAPGSPVRLAARCGTLVVPEDRDTEGGREIALRVAVVPAVSRNPAPDPLVFLTGGPGQAASETYPLLAPAFRRVNRDRDVVLVDQRGTGGSNPIRCPDEDEAELALLDRQAVSDWVSRCLEELDADPRFYTTAIAMRDLDQVREVLGYARVNLYGLSYGTRAALTYMRMFPDRVRAAILDGVVPQTETLGLDVAKDAQRALELMIERCAAEPACKQAFPDLAADVGRVMNDLAAPVPVSLRHPRTGEAQTLEFGREMAAYAVRLLSYSQETASLVPLLIRSAAASDRAPLAAQFLIASSQLGESMAAGMGFSVLCTEDFPFLTQEEIEKANRGTYLEDLQTDALKLVCPLWPRGRIPEDFKEPVRSSAPVLLLSGEADPVTPPSSGDLVAEQLGEENARHLVAKGQGHIVIHRGCIPRLAYEFLEAASFASLDTACVLDIEGQPFFTSFAGPTP